MDARTDDRAGLGRRNRPRRTPKGRQVDPQALAQVCALLGDRERRRDLLIEHLHLIQDRYGYLSAAHLAALAQEMKLAQTGARSQAPMQGARTTRTAPSSFPGNSRRSRSAPAMAQESESQTRTVTAGGGVSPSFTTSQWA